MVSAWLSVCMGPLVPSRDFNDRVKEEGRRERRRWRRQKRRSGGRGEEGKKEKRKRKHVLCVKCADVNPSGI